MSFSLETSADEPMMEELKSSSMSDIIPIDVGKDVPSMQPPELPRAKTLAQLALEEHVQTPKSLAEHFIKEYKQEILNYLAEHLENIKALKAEV